VCVTFNERTTPEELAAAISDAWFAAGRHDRTIPVDPVAFEPYTSRAQAREVGAWFSKIVAQAA
jgi:hypothetical protein